MSKIAINDNIIPLYDECLSIVNDRDRESRMKEMKEEDKFYFNAQWTGEESAELESTGQVDITLNAMRRAFRTLISLMIGGMPTAKFLPRDMIPGNEQEKMINQQIQPVLKALNGLWNHCWYISRGQIRMRRAVQSQIVMGQGWLNIYLDPKADFYRGELKFTNRLPWEMVIPLSANEIDFSDTHRMWYRRLVPLAEIARMLDKTSDESFLRKLQENAYIINAENAEYDYDVHMLSPEQREVYNHKFTRSGDYSYDPVSNLAVEWFEMDEKVDIPAILYKVPDDRGFIQTLVFVPDDPRNAKDADPEKLLAEQGLNPGDAEKTDITVPRIKRTKFIGRDMQVDKPEVLPISSYPTVPVIDEDTYNPLSYGEAYFVKPAQKLLNKTFSLATLHLQTSGSGDRLIGFKGAFGTTPQEVENFQKHFSQPSSATELGMEYMDGVPIGSMMQRMQATPLQPAAVQIIQMLTYWIDRLTGIDPISFGSTTGSTPRTLGATLSIKEWGDENARIPITHLNASLQQLGEVWMEWALAHYTFPKSFGVPDHNSALQQYGINIPDEGQIINNIEGIKANIFITSGSSLMLNRYSQLMMFKELIPLSPVFAKLFIMMSDLPDKFDIMNEMDYTANLEQQMQELLSQMDQAQQAIQQLSEEVQDEKQKNLLTKFSGSLKVIETKYRERLKYDAKQYQDGVRELQAAAKSANQSGQE